MTPSPGSAPADTVYLSKLTQLPSQIVFIMGCHRSGTSMLYHLLAYTGVCDYLSVYDIVQYDELLANRIEGREDAAKQALDAAVRVEKTRGLDDLPVSAGTPEEYRFLLSPPAPDWFFNPNEPDGRRVFAPHLTRERLDRFLEICRKKAFLSGGKPLILKNPNDHYFNFGEICRMLPEARMIFIHRHPLHILNSYIKGFSGILETRSEYLALLDERYRTLFQSPLTATLLKRLFQGETLPRTLARALSQSYTYYLEQTRQMPPDHYLSLRYEDLCGDPQTHLERIGRFLGIPITPQVPANFVAPRRLNVPEHLLKAYQEHAGGMREYLESQHYSLFPDIPAVGAAMLHSS